MQEISSAQQSIIDKINALTPEEVYAGFQAAADELHNQDGCEMRYKSKHSLHFLQYNFGKDEIKSMITEYLTENHTEVSDPVMLAEGLITMTYKPNEALYKTFSSQDYMVPLYQAIQEKIVASSNLQKLKNTFVKKACHMIYCRLHDVGDMETMAYNDMEEFFRAEFRALNEEEFIGRIKYYLILSLACSAVKTPSIVHPDRKTAFIDNQYYAYNIRLNPPVYFKVWIFICDWVLKFFDRQTTIGCLQNYIKQENFWNYFFATLYKFELEPQKQTCKLYRIVEFKYEMNDLPWSQKINTDLEQVYAMSYI